MFNQNTAIAFLVITTTTVTTMYVKWNYAFCYSPYWIQSYQETFSDFKHMGLWEYCFDQFRYPYYQFDKLFDGCHYIFSQEYYVIREWLLPGWSWVFFFSKYMLNVANRPAYWNVNEAWLGVQC